MHMLRGPQGAFDASGPPRGIHPSWNSTPSIPSPRFGVEIYK